MNSPVKQTKTEALPLSPHIEDQNRFFLLSLSTRFRFTLYFVEPFWFYIAFIY